MISSNGKGLGHALMLALCTVLSFAASAQNYRQVVYYHTDALQSPVAASDENGNVIWRESYKPYGERLLKEAEETNSLGAVIETPWDEKLWFTGKQEEYSLKLQNFGARWYDQETGRFLSIDPVGPLEAVEGNTASFNRYIYANHNPYLYVDRDGREAILTVDGNNVEIRIPIKYTGPGATAETTQKFNRGIETYWTGKFGRFNVTTTVTNSSEYGVLNEIVVPLGDGEANVVGGARGTWPEERPAWTAAHEAGHLMGLRDEYDKDTGNVNPGWENNIMGSHGKPADFRNIIGIKENEKNIKLENKE